MLLKGAGMILIMVSSTVLGLYYSWKDYYRIEDLDHMKKAFLMLKSEIEYTLTPIPAAIASVSEKVPDSAAADIFNTFKNYLDTRGREGADKLWSLSLEGSKSSCFLAKEDYTALASFARSAGGADIKLQLGTIDMILNYIEGKTEELTVLGAKNGKLYRSLGILGGMALCIIFI